MRSALRPEGPFPPATDVPRRPIADLRPDRHSVPDVYLIRIAAALIDDDSGQLFLVRKRGTCAFMQAGGKIDGGETPLQALLRELDEELNFAPDVNGMRFLGTFSCPAAHEPDHLLEAHLFHVPAPKCQLMAAAELEEAIWVSVDAAHEMSLAPFTRECVLPLAKTLRS